MPIIPDEARTFGLDFLFKKGGRTKGGKDVRMERSGRWPDAPWSEEEKRILGPLRTPMMIQEFLDAIPYNGEITCRSPRRVLKDRKAHCMEGALFAAAALARVGHRPVLLDMGAVRDDDHVLALFEQRGCYGSLAKSNYSGLRYRPAVFRTLRELVMSYFDDYFNPSGERTLRSYSVPLVLAESVYPGWRIAEEELDPIGDRLTQLRHYRLLTREQERGLPPVDRRLLEAGLLGSNPAGLYKG